MKYFIAISLLVALISPLPAFQVGGEDPGHSVEIWSGSVTGEHHPYVPGPVWDGGCCQYDSFGMRFTSSGPTGTHVYTFEHQVLEVIAGEEGEPPVTLEGWQEFHRETAVDAHDPQIHPHAWDPEVFPEPDPLPPIGEWPFMYDFYCWDTEDPGPEPNDPRHGTPSGKIAPNAITITWAHQGQYKVRIRKWKLMPDGTAGELLATSPTRTFVIIEHLHD